VGNILVREDTKESERAS